MGHKYYAIKRKDVFIESIKDVLYNNSYDYGKYKTKVLTFIKDNDINSISQSLFIRPNVIFSIFNFGLQY